MKVRIVRIGNSQGIRIPKLLLEQTGLRDEVELEVRAGSLVLRAPAADDRGGASTDAPYPLAGEVSFVGEAVPAEEDFAGLLARAARGEEVVVERGGRPVARLVPIAAEPRRPGRLKGRIRIAPDFDSPLPPELAAAFRGEGA
jgi:prevent-host-death family protein